MRAGPESPAGLASPRFATHAARGRWGGGAWGVALGAILTGIWSWWAWSEGAYFGVVFFPGAILLYLTLIALLLLAPWRGNLRLGWGPPLALWALVLLGAWTLLSAFWSPAPDAAFSDGHRVLLYACSFGLGFWLCHLLGRRMLLSLLPLALAGGVAGLATAIAFVVGDEPSRFLDPEGTLEFPIGYRNANAAFFLIAFWSAISLAASGGLDWRLRGAILGAASLCVEMALLSQSRGSALALVPALVVWLVFFPWRIRAAVWLGLALAPSVVALPWLLDVYQAANAGTPVSGTLQDAGWAVILSSAAGIAIGALAARLEPRRGRSPRPLQPLGRRLVASFAGIVAAASILLLAAGTDPIEWVGQRAVEFRSSTSPDLSEEKTRFGANATTQRGDLWRVALEDARERPLLGQGAGAFQFSYLREGRTDITPRDAHSVELELLSELGAPGVALFAAAVIGAVAGALRSRRLGPDTAALSAAALATGAYWLAHSSIDWFWTYPVLTAPVVAMLGSAGAPAAMEGSGARRPGLRPLVAGGAIVLSVATLPLYLSERYTDSAYAGWREDLEGAYSDLAAAQDLNPFSDAPLLAEGAIAREAGDTERAVEAFQAASERRPEEWASHYFLGLLLAPRDPAAAEAELEIAAELYPRSEEVRRAQARLRRAGASQ